MWQKAEWIGHPMRQGYIIVMYKALFSMWHKAEWLGHPTRQGYIIVIYKALCFDVADLRNGATNETRLYYSNLQSSLLRCGTRQNELGTQLDQGVLS